MRILQGYLLSIVSFALAMTLTCGGGGGSNPTPATPQLTISAPGMVTTGDQKTATATLIQGASYNWTIQGGTFTSGNTTNNVSFTVGAPGTLVLGCAATIGAQELTASAPMEVLPLPVINSFQATPASISAGESVQLSADFINGVGNIQPGNLTITNNVPLTVTPAVTTIYTLNDTNAAGGNAVFATLVIVGAGNPVAVTAPANVTANQSGYAASVSPQTGCTYAWMITNGTITSSVTNPSITFTAGISGSVNLACTITNAAGTSSALGSATLTIVPPDTTLVINAPANVAAGATGLTASVQAQSVSTYAWTINGGTITSGSTSDTIVFTADASGTVQLGCTVTNAAGTPSAPGTATLTIIPSPEINSFVSSNLTIKPGQTSTLSWSVIGATGLSIDQGVGSVSGLSVTVTPATSTTYTMTAINGVGGSTTASVTVWVTASGLSTYAAGVSVIDPGYWVNGSWISLPSPSDSDTWQVTSIAVSGNNIYAGGNYGTSSIQAVPGYWLNGNWVNLTMVPGSTWGGVTSIVSSGSDIYAGGYCVNRQSLSSPGYWLNGTWVGLTAPSGSSSIVSSLVMTGGNLYAAGYYGYYSSGQNETLPCYWLNGTLVDLTLPSGSSDGQVNSIVVSGSDLYAGGFCISGSAASPGYWLNGTWIGLPSMNGAVNSIAVSGSNVYAGGYSNPYVPGYWLNGTWVGLALPSGSAEGRINSMIVSGSDVYAGGFCLGGPEAGPGYWFDGTWVEVTGGGGESILTMTVQ